MQGTSTRAGRHRAPRRPRGPLGLVVAVAVLVAMFGVGATLLSPSLTGTPDPTSRQGTTAAAGGAGGSGSAAVSAPAPAMPPSPTTASAAPTASPTRTTAPMPRRTPGRTSTRASSGGTPAQQVLAIVNRERAANGCGAVTINDRLTTAARLHSEDQATHDTMSHTGSDGSSPWERSERAGYEYAIGENVAAGYRNADAVMAGWMKSPGHRDNILNCRARAMGLAAAVASDGTFYWTQMFGSVA